MSNYAERYVKAMVRGDVDACIAIEQATDLFGYPPELVAIGLRAYDQGLSADAAVAAYINDVVDEYLASFSPGAQP